MPGELTRADRPIAALGVLGAAIAGYLTYVHYAGIDPVCVGGSGCHTVQASEYAEVVAIPVALLGLIGYLAILASLALRGEAGRFTTASLALAGAGFSLYLTHLELFVIKAICQWCVASAVVMLVLAGLSVRRLLRG